MTEDTTPTVKRRSVMKAAAAAGATFSVADVAVATPGREPGPKENEVLVGVSDGHDLEGSVAPQVPGNAEIVHKNEDIRYAAVRFPSPNDAALENFLDGITNAPGVKYAERNETFETQLTPNDPQFGSQYAPQNTNADDAWDTTFGSSNVTIAVVDTGVQYTHPDLDGNFGSDVGRDFVDGDQDPAPDAPSNEFHGTHVSGIAAAETDNGEGVAGISDSTLLSARALDESGGGSLSDIADAITWAGNNGADVINMSIGGGGFNQTMKNAVSSAHDNGSTLVAAAGNAGATSVDFPAGYSEVIAVSAIDENNNLASFSNTGTDVELAAPGVDVLSTTTGARGSYETLSGTSMASPVVAGVAGLTIAQWGTDNATTRSHLKNTAVDIGLSSDAQGSGRVDAANAVNTDPSGDDDDDDDGGGGTCGNNSTSGSVTDSLSSSFDADCWFWSWEFADPCEVVVELSGPVGTDFDLYVNEGIGSCPSTSSFTHRSISPDSQETITITNPDTSTDLFILADSWSGSGTYTLTITEKTT